MGYRRKTNTSAERSKSFHIDLGEINALYFKLSAAAKDITPRVKAIANMWAKETLKEYRSNAYSLQNHAYYGKGFEGKYSNLKPFKEVTSKDFKIRVIIGHENFIARFLEVGTSAHATRGNTNVSGIQGSGVLSSIMNKDKDGLYKDLNDYIKNYILSNNL